MSKKAKNPFKNGVCVAPVGRTLPKSKKRLTTIPKQMRPDDPEHIMVRLWAKENIRERNIDFGFTPVDSILHRCNERCSSGHHYYDAPKDEEVRIVSATIQWLATNCGRRFLGDFQKEMEKLNERYHKKLAERYKPQTHTSIR